MDFVWARSVFFEVPVVNIPVYFYGFFVSVAFVIGYVLFEKELRRKQLKADASLLCGLSLVGSFSCSKLTYLFFLDGSTADPGQGHSFQGGVVGAAVITLLCCLWYRLPVLDLFDLIAPILCLGHGIGKLGCFFAGDGCYGPPTEMPWGMSFPNGLIPTKEYVHPTPLYEFTWSCTVFAYLWMKRTQRRWPGDQIWYMMIVFGLERVFLEAFRGHKAEYLGNNLSIYQMWAGGGVILGLILQAVSHLYYDGRILHSFYKEEKNTILAMTKRISELEEMSTRSSLSSRKEKLKEKDESTPSRLKRKKVSKVESKEDPKEKDESSAQLVKPETVSKGRESTDSGMVIVADSNTLGTEPKPKQAKKKGIWKKGGSKQKETITTEKTTAATSYTGAPSLHMESEMADHKGTWEIQKGGRRRAKQNLVYRKVEK